MTNKQKVLQIYPNAEWRKGIVSLPVAKHKWRTYSIEKVLPGIWVNNNPIVYGGKYEIDLWKRAWKAILKETLMRLES